MSRIGVPSRVAGGFSRQGVRFPKECAPKPPRDPHASSLRLSRVRSFRDVGRLTRPRPAHVCQAKSPQDRSLGWSSRRFEGIVVPRHRALGASLVGQPHDGRYPVPAAMFGEPRSDILLELVSDHRRVGQCRCMRYVLLPSQPLPMPLRRLQFSSQLLPVTSWHGGVPTYCP